MAPVCSVAAARLKSHDEFADITDQVTLDIWRWLDGRLANGDRVPRDP